MSEQTFVTGESDPADFTVDQVNEHLATADEDEVARVRDLETGPDGKDRVGIKFDSDPEGPGTETRAETLAEAVKGQPNLEGEAYQRGYFGHVPSRDGDEPEDLTLQGVLKRQNGED